MKILFNWLSGLFYLVNVIYAFLYWGGGHGMLNLFIPYAIIADLVMKFGRIK